MTKRIFFSHSSRDRLLIENIKKGFSEKCIEPYFAFEEHEGAPPIIKIQNAISNSPAMFVLVTEKVLKNKHTRDWVSYEIGFAKGLEKCEEKEKRVFAWIISTYNIETKKDEKKDELAYLKCLTDYQEIDLIYVENEETDGDRPKYEFYKKDIDDLVQKITEKASEIIEIIEIPQAEIQQLGEVSRIIPLTFGITQLTPRGFRRTFPDVTFNIENPNNSPIRANVLAQVFLGGEYIATLSGHYSGEQTWNLNPLSGVSGHFQIPQEAVESEETLEVKVTVEYHDEGGKEYRLLPVGFVYLRDQDEWYFNP